VTELCGLTWKGKADIVTDDYVIDLKTTADINKFKYSARSYNYDSQCYIYQQLFGRPLVFLAVDKETCQLGMFQPSTEFVEGGAKKVERASEIFKVYYGDNATESIINHYIKEIL